MACQIDEKNRLLMKQRLLVLERRAKVAFSALAAEWSVYAALAVLKLSLVRGQSLMAHPAAGHDDGLFLSLASSIAVGNWLGDYTQFTLMKGPIYPLFIAGSHALHLPLLFSEQILYLLACGLTVAALAPILRLPWQRVVVFGLLLFNPASFMIHQVLREGIYPALSLMVVATALGTWLRIGHSLRLPLAWAVLLGLSLAAFWLTREEGIWILPAIVPLCLAGAARCWRVRDGRRAMLAVLCLPPLILGCSVATVAAFNYRHYKIFTTVETKEESFVAAYGALLRVRQERPVATVPLPTEARLKIYPHSQAFSKLHPFLEGDLGKAWMGSIRRFLIDGYNDQVRHYFEDYFRLPFPLTGSEAWDFIAARYRIDAVFASKLETLLGGKTNVKELFEGQDDEIHGWAFIWTLRDATCLAGYCGDGNTASAFYRQIAAEINSACSSLRLDCLPERNSLRPPWHAQYFKPVVETLAGGMRYLVMLDGMNVYPRASTGTSEQLRTASAITRERLFPAQYELRGWAVADSGKPVKFEVFDDEWRNSDVKDKLPGEDEYKHLRTEGIDAPQTRFTRFEIKTDCVNADKCVLSIQSGEQQLGRIPLSAMPTQIDRDGFKVVIDTVGLIHASAKEAHAHERKLQILRQIHYGYQQSMPFLFLLALAAYVYLGIRSFESGSSRAAWWIASVILVLVAGRMLMLSYIAVTSFPAINVPYMSPLYPLLILFVAVCLTNYHGFSWRSVRATS